MPCKSQQKISQPDWGESMRAGRQKNERKMKENVDFPFQK